MRLLILAATLIQAWNVQSRVPDPAARSSRARANDKNSQRLTSTATQRFEFVLRSSSGNVGDKPRQLEMQTGDGFIALLDGANASTKNNCLSLLQFC